MNKNIFCLSIGLCLCAGPYPVMAQKASSGTVDAPATKVKKVEVKDYKSFKEYVANEEANLKTKPVTMNNGPIRNKLLKMGIAFPKDRTEVLSQDGSKHASQTSDKKWVSVIDDRNQTINVYGANGALLSSVPFSKYPEGAIAASKTRLFIISEGFEGRRGFEIYDLSGKLLKDVTDGYIDDHIVSNTQQYFAVTTRIPESETRLLLYDLNGNELWQHNLAQGWNTEVQFSLDDNFLIVKVPLYVDSTKEQSAGKLKEKKLYIFDVVSRKLVSEEAYD